MNLVPIPKLGDLLPNVEPSVTVKSVAVVGLCVENRLPFPKLNFYYAVEKLTISW